MTDVTILGFVRGAMRNLFGQGNGQAITLGDGGEVLMAQALPPLTDLVRQGRTCQVALTTGIAALTALPTTTGGLSLWNGEAGPTGRCYVIDSFGTWEAVTDATQNDTAVLFACNNVGPITPPTDSGIVIRTTLGSRYGGSARTVSGATIVNDGWYGHGWTMVTPPTVFAGTLWRVQECKVDGLYIVKPGGQFNTQIVKSAAAAAAQQFHFIRWHESYLATT